MTARTVISVENLSKAYELYRKPSDVLKEVFLGRKRHDLFWALRNVSFSVHEKQRVGIIGANGAGKSTLLQIITGNLQPTDGTVTVDGRVSALLSMTPAWSLEDSGLENIRFNLILQGCDPAALPRLTEEIVDFTELGHFIYRPVKTYSTGMSARLSFAIATAISPEILIIDEVLGVGDGYFAGKATERMKQMCDRGKALLLVSHSLGAIRAICDVTIWLENGEVRMMGPVDRVVTAYEEDTLRTDEETRRAGNMRRLRETMHLAAPEDITESSYCRVRLRERDNAHVHHTHYIRRIAVLDAAGGERDIPLYPVDIRQQHTEAALDLSGCEWGRVYSRRERECRILAPRTGARKGGHVLLRRPTGEAEDWALRLVVEVADEPGSEQLSADFLNVREGAWTVLHERERRRGEDGWVVLTFDALVPAFSADHQTRALRKAALDLRPPVQITEIALIADGARVHHVRETQPFKLRIGIRQHEVVASTSVNIQITRSDGVYAFYQPSGLDGRNIENFVGDATVEFDFTQNPLGAGDYEVGVFVCNGWSWDNIPPSEIFDRSIGVYRFTVQLATPITFGLINVRVPVSFEFDPPREVATGVSASDAV